MSGAGGGDRARVVPRRWRRAAGGRAGPRCRPARRGGCRRRRGRPCRHRRTGRRRCRASARRWADARCTAQPFTTPLGSRTGTPSGPGAAYVEGAAGLHPRPLAERRAPRGPRPGSRPGRSRRGPAGRPRSPRGRC